MAHPFFLQLKPLAISEHACDVNSAGFGLDTSGGIAGARSGGGTAGRHHGRARDRRGSGALAPLPWGKATPCRAGSQSTPPRPTDASMRSPPMIWVPPPCPPAPLALPALAIGGAVLAPKPSPPLPGRSIFHIVDDGPRVEAPRDGKSVTGSASGGSGGGAGAGWPFRSPPSKLGGGQGCAAPVFGRSVSTDSGSMQQAAAAARTGVSAGGRVPRPTLVVTATSARPRKRTTEHLCDLEDAAPGNPQRYRLGQDQVPTAGTGMLAGAGGAVGEKFSPADRLHSPGGGYRRRLKSSPMSRFRALSKAQ
jgi:hypothetical protein